MIHNEVLQLRFVIQIGDDTQAGNLYESGERMRTGACGNRDTRTCLNRLLRYIGNGLCIPIFGQVLQPTTGCEDETGCDQDTDEPGGYRGALARANGLSCLPLA